MSTYKSLIKSKLVLQIAYLFSDEGYSPLAVTNISKHFLIGHVKVFLPIDQVKVLKRL